MSVQIILKSSAVQDKAATAQQIEIGEIALNYHESGPFLQCKDTAGQVWRIGGVIVAPEAPGQPQPGTWWFETDTKGLYFYDGTGWTEITGGGGGAGDITAVVAGEGLSGGGNAGTVTLDADLDLTKGLEFIVHGVDGSKIAIKPGANISFDTDGSLRADIASVSIKGTVDLTSATIPSPVTANDGYYNTVGGTLSAAWQAATGEGAITVYPGDTVVYNGTSWNYVPGSPGAVTSVFGRIGAVVATEGDYDIGELGDVDTTTAAPANGDVLQYDGTNWVPVDETVVAPVQSVHGRTGAVVSAEGDYDLDELGDVDLTSTPPTTNDVLQYDGANWVPGTVTAGVASVFGRTGAVVATEGDYDLDELGDVDLTTTAPVTNDLLQYDGTNWVPAAAAGATPAGVAGSVQINDGAGNLGAVTDFIWDSANTELDVPGDINLDDGGTYTTTLQSVTATADRFISFPDQTGVVSLVSGVNGAVQFNNAGVSGGSALAVDATTKAFGYGSDGGAITQATNKATAVTLNKPTGQITMNAAALAADTTVTFTLTNSSIAAGDILILNHLSAGTAGAYTLNSQSAVGSASINVRNITAGSLSEAIVIGFAVIKSTTV